MRERGLFKAIVILLLGRFLDCHWKEYSGDSRPSLRVSQPTDCPSDYKKSGGKSAMRNRPYCLKLIRANTYILVNDPCPLNTFALITDIRFLLIYLKETRAISDDWTMKHEEIKNQNSNRNGCEICKRNGPVIQNIYRRIIAFVSFTSLMICIFKEYLIWSNRTSGFQFPIAKNRFRYSHKFVYLDSIHTLMLLMLQKMM